MNNSIIKSIEEIYISKKYECYISKCKNQINLLDKFECLLKKYVKDISEMNLENSPACVWYLDFNKFNNINYRTLIYISKIIPIYYIQHEFEVEDNNPNRMGPTLDGFGGQPYTTQQADVSDSIRNEMNKLGYEEIDYNTFNENVLIKKNDDVTEILNGEQYAISGLLFNDILGITD